MAIVVRSFMQGIQWCMRTENGEIRRYRWFAGWDCSKKGASLFITMATESRRPLFGEVRGGAVALSPLGVAVRNALDAMPQLNLGLSLFGRVVMPDHVHFNCVRASGLGESLKVLGNAVRRFKNHITKLARIDVRTAFGQSNPQKLWQQGYHDYILLSRQMIDSTERYIAYNPLKWEMMHCSPTALRIHEPLSSPRLDPGDYWKGIGNLALLSVDVKLLSLRVSRAVGEAKTAKMLARIGSAVSQGYMVISGFISRGEQAVRDMLCARRDARFIRILLSCIPNVRFKSESRYVAPFSDGRYLEIARGNEETEFGRSACLDLNAEIVEIATACEGLAVYWKADDPHVLARHGEGLDERSSSVKSCHNAARRIFVTGGTGFFGKSMLDYRLRHPEWEWSKADWVVLSRSPDKFRAEYPTLANQRGISFIAGDIRDFALPDEDFDAVIHAATSATTTLPDDEMTSVILDGTRRVVEFARFSNCKTVLFTSSGAVYGPRTSACSEGDWCNPVTAYGKGKLAAEKILLESGLDVKIARCFAFVGPYLNRKIHYAIGNFIQDCMDEKPITIMGDGTPLRSYLFADDLVEWLFTILERGESCRPCNVGSDMGLSIRELADTVCCALGKVNAITVKSRAKPGEKPSVYVPDVTLARTMLGLDVKVRLDEAIRRSAV